MGFGQLKPNVSGRLVAGIGRAGNWARPGDQAAKKSAGQAAPAGAVMGTRFLRGLDGSPKVSGSGAGAQGDAELVELCQVETG